MYSVSWWKKFSLFNRERNKSAVKILGIDPGSVKCGYGVISIEGKSPIYIASGTISLSASHPLQLRLKHIFDGLMHIILTYRPDNIVIEKIFFAKGARAALSLGHARGIALLAAAHENISLHECTALEVKKAVVGYGRAEKSQVQEMVKLILNVKGSLSPDGADALALALCYSNTLQFKEKITKSRVLKR